MFICGACGGVGKWREERPKRISWSFFFKYLKDIGDYFSLDLRFCK